MTLPAGSILSGVSVTGMDAPTGKQAQRDPFPSLIRVKNEAILLTASGLISANAF